MIYVSQGDPENALVHCQKALEVLLAMHGQQHPDVATTKFNLALLHKERGEKDVARTLFDESHSVDSCAGTFHPHTMMAGRGARECL